MNSKLEKMTINLSSYVFSLANRIFKLDRNPRKVARIYRDFDISRGYGHYHNVCQKSFSRKELLTSDNLLSKQGFEYLDIISSTRSLDLIQSIKASHPISYLKKDTKNLTGYHLTDRNLIRNILSCIFTDHVERQLVNFFKSEYLVHWLIFSVTPQAKEQKSVSFRWHCDRGPTAHLKLIVYLNATETHGGNTEFISKADTKDIAANGYLYGWTKARSNSIQYLSEIAGRKISSHLKAMRAGEGVLFQPSTVLHRGVSPALGPRYTITLCLLPSPFHWKQALACNTLSDLTKDDAWHQKADHLMHAMKQPESYTLTND